MRWSLLSPLFLTLASTPAFAQFDNQWVEFARDDSRLAVGAQLLTASDTEVDFAWGDVNKDGWEDLVVVRKEEFTTTGKRTNMLFLNVNGVLRNRTALYASASDVPGDMGFLTPTNDRDVVLVDVDMDGWLDIVTATTLSNNNDTGSKVLNHPRVYMNLGLSPTNQWLGFRHEDGRFPQLFTTSGECPPATAALNPRFCSVAAGDVTGDGYPDLYFGDYDGSQFGLPQPSGNDMNDRLMVNDGNGFFRDESCQRMTTTMLESAFGMATVIHDMNGDGLMDIVKDTALNAPQDVSVSYNNPSNEGFFLFFDPFHGNLPYHIAVDDLNNDGRPDIVAVDDELDRLRYNLGNDALGRVIWGPARTFRFLSGSDDGFGGNIVIADLDNDGWKDVIIADVDVDSPGCNRRTHIYHNQGGAIGSQIRPIEERQQAGGNGWIGVVGMRASDLTGTHDIATMDLDNDGDLDMVVSRCTGTHIWMNQTNQPPELPVKQPKQVGSRGTGRVNFR